MEQTGARSLDSRSRRGGKIDTRDDGRHAGLTPAQWYCLLAGAALLLAGIFGFVADASFDTSSPDGELQGDSFLGFEVNGWHNVVHLASGLVLLAAFRRRGPAKAVALAFGLVYGLVTIIGLIDGSDILGLIPVNPADNVLHLALAAAGILAALVSPTDEHRRGRSPAARDRHRLDEPATTVDRDDRFGRDSETARAGRDYDPLSGRPRDDRTITRND